MHLRKFTSLVITFAFVIMTYTGVILFLTPKGRVAHGIDWELFGLAKDQYEALHVTFMLIFVIGMILHIYLNWKPLVSYFKNRAHEFSLFTKEFSLAFGLTLVFLIGTLGELPPFQTFLNFQEDIKNSWEKKSQTAPYGHAEDSTLKEFAKNIDQDTNQAIKLLEKEGIKGVNANAKLSEIAKFNHLSANDIYKIISPKYKKTFEESKETSIVYPKQGLGRMTLEEVSLKYNLKVEKIIAILKEKNINATKDSKMKKLSNELDLTPLELFELFAK